MSSKGELDIETLKRELADAQSSASNGQDSSREAAVQARMHEAIAEQRRQDNRVRQVVLRRIQGGYRIAVLVLLLAVTVLCTSGVSWLRVNTRDYEFPLEPFLPIDIRLTGCDRLLIVPDQLPPGESRDISALLRVTAHSTTLVPHSDLVVSLNATTTNAALVNATAGDWQAGTCEAVLFLAPSLIENKGDADATVARTPQSVTIVNLDSETLLVADSRKAGARTTALKDMTSPVVKIDALSVAGSCELRLRRLNTRRALVRLDKGSVRIDELTLTEWPRILPLEHDSIVAVDTRIETDDGDVNIGSLSNDYFLHYSVSP